MGRTGIQACGEIVRRELLGENAVLREAGIPSLNAKSIGGGSVQASEGLLEDLMREVSEGGDIYTLERYESVLRPKYSAQIRDMYRDHVLKEVLRVNCRDRYRHLANNLKKITRYEGGREIAGQIANNWREEYRRRPAFMDELDKAGF